MLFSIYRGGRKGKYITYEMPYQSGMTVLDVLLYVQRYVDATLAFRYECRQGICGTCGLMLNGVPVLSCRTQIDQKKNKHTIGPLENYPVEKDLIVNLLPILKRFRAVRPYLDKIQEVMMTKSQANESKPFRKCIECGCCIAGSKTFSQNKDILDPMDLVKIARYVTDPRDGSNRKVIAQKGGVEKYTPAEAKKIAGICPRGVPIDKAIQLLKTK